MGKKGIFIVLLFVLCRSSFAQEFNCQVSIISPALQTSPADKQVFTELQGAIREFINNTRWTADNYKVEERIDMNMTINISEQPSADEFGGTIQITSRRTVFSSSYPTTVFNYIDENFKFKYQRGTAIQFSIDRHRDNLSSIIGFYCYVVLAYDYDTYSLEGGTKYFVKAQQIVSNAQGTSEPGWRAAEGIRNRYWLVENALQQLFQPLRVAFFKYHREGFDKFVSDMPGGMKSVFESLDEINKVAQARPGSFNVQLFFSTKVNELVDLFKGASPEDKNKAFNLLKKLDPSNLNQYQKILSNK